MPDDRLGGLQARLASLDAQEAALAEVPAELPTAAEAAAYCADLPSLWVETDADGRRAIAEAVFERIDVLGVSDYTFTPTPAAIAHGWDAAFGPGERAGSIGHSGRGERASAATNDIPIRMRLARPPLRLLDERSA